MEVFFKVYCSCEMEFQIRLDLGDEEMKKDEVLKRLKGGLIVSCQALEGEPLYREEGGVMSLMALAAKEGGACAIRTNGITDLKTIKGIVDLPIIGHIKKVYEGYEPYITPTLEEVDALVESGCHIIAIDATKRLRVGNVTIETFVEQIKEKYPTQLLMADISTFEEGEVASKLGFDFISTTLSGYTSYSSKKEGPDLDLLEQLVNKLETPIVAEGRIHYPEQAKRALETGAYCVVVGGAITRPKEITARFVKQLID